jgi:hypothetical protein
MGASSVTKKDQQSDQVVLPDGRTGQMVMIGPFPKPLPRVPNPPAPATNVEAWSD